MLRAILFDFNGVLVDDEPIHLELLQQVLAEEGLALTADDDYAKYLGLDDRSCFAGALSAAGLPATPPRIMRLVARKASYYQERIRRDGYPFFSGAVNLVTALAEAGRRLGIVSGALREEVEGGLRQVGLRERFKILVSAEDVEEGKPDPAGYLLALAALSSEPPLPERLFHPHEVLAVEDSPAGLAAAGQAGLLTLGVAHTYPAERLAGAHAVVDRLADLTVSKLDRLLAEASRR